MKVLKMRPITALNLLLARSFTSAGIGSTALLLVVSATGCSQSEPKVVERIGFDFSKHMESPEPARKKQYSDENHGAQHQIDEQLKHLEAMQLQIRMQQEFNQDLLEQNREFGRQFGQVVVE